MNWIINILKFLHNSNDGFIFTSFNDKIIQFQIINDQKGNFIDLQKFDEIDDGVDNEAIITTDNGKIFYKKYIEDSNNKSLLALENYKNNRYDWGFKSSLDKYLNFWISWIIGF